MKYFLQIIFFILFFSTLVAAQDLSNISHLSDAEIESLLQQRVEKDKKASDLVVGLINSKGSKIITYGKLSDSISKKLDGDTVYEIGSITKVFTSMILADMVKNGEVSLNDPISKYLPKSVKVPTRNGKEITLFDLSTHTSGLPRMPNNFAPKDPTNPFADYDVEKMYEFLSNYSLPRDIGSQNEYSNLGVGLLGHILALKAGTDYETLVKTRICEPLKMNNTSVKLSPELKERLAVGHNETLKAVPNWDITTLAGAGALRATTNDLLKFLAANMGLTESKLSPAMLEMQRDYTSNGNSALEVHLGWGVEKKHGSHIFWHNGGTGGYRTFIGFNKTTGLGVVVLSNVAISPDDIGFHLLEKKYPLEKVLVATKVDSKILESYVGVYQVSSDTFRNITRYRDRLFIQRTGQPKREILPTSETEFFIKDSNVGLFFAKDSNGKVTKMIVFQPDGTEDSSPKIDKTLPEKHKTIEIDTTIYNSYVGKYQFPGTQLFFTIAKDGDKLMAELTGQISLEVFPESENKFFYNAVEAQLSFVKDEKGRVTDLILHQNGQDQKAQKIE